MKEQVAPLCERLRHGDPHIGATCDEAAAMLERLAEACDTINSYADEVLSYATLARLPRYGPMPAKRVQALMQMILARLAEIGGDK